jgi:hypothetical protein
MSKSFGLTFILASVGLATAQLSGTGIIHVLQTANEKFADVNNKVGCLSTTGRFIKPQNPAMDCGLYNVLATYPYNVFTSAGNCTFDDKTQPANTDSHYGGLDYAWYCGNSDYDGTISDGLYTLVRIVPS